MNAVKCPCCNEWAYEDEIVDKKCVKCDSFPEVDDLSAKLYDDYLRMQEDDEDYSWLFDDMEDLEEELLLEQDELDDEWMHDYWENTL